MGHWHTLLLGMSPGFPGMKVLQPPALCRLDLSVHGESWTGLCVVPEALRVSSLPDCQFRVILCERRGYGTWTLCPVLSEARGSQLGVQDPAISPVLT